MLEPGQVLVGRYEICDQIGEGGMGLVYRALDTLARPPRPVALKVAVINTETQTPNPARLRNVDVYDTRPHGMPSTFEIQFKIEAKLLFNLTHPNLPQVENYFRVNEQYFLVMDFIEGNDLYRMMEINHNTPFAEEKMLTWFSQVLDALEYCHQQMVFHRDIKPENIIVTPDGEVFLVDFGIAYLASDLTHEAFPAATLSFCPPEQLDPLKPYDARSDIYAVGATLYFLLTGEMPADVVERQQGTEIIRPRHLNSSLSLETEGCILRAMEFNPEDRFASVAEMRSALGISSKNSHEIFISFAHQDEFFAKALCTGLEKRNRTCWVAPRDIPPDTTWPAAISDAIDHASVFLLILTNFSNKSTQVAREITMADNKGLPILCVRAEDVLPSNRLSYYLSNIQWLDSFGQPDEAIINRLAETIHNQN